MVAPRHPHHLLVSRFAGPYPLYRSARTLSAHGYALCRWTADTFDWDGPGVEQMVERITYGDHRSPPVEAGGNILMHGTGTNTAGGLQQIIDAVRAKGLTLDPLDQPPGGDGDAAQRPSSRAAAGAGAKPRRAHPGDCG